MVSTIIYNKLGLQLHSVESVIISFLKKKKNYLLLK